MIKTSTNIEYYIAIGDDTKIYCPISKTDRNIITTWFQNNWRDFEEKYGTELVSKAKLIEETTEVTSREEFTIGRVKFVLICTPPEANGWNYYITKSATGNLFISSAHTDLVGGNIIFDCELAAKRWLERNIDTLKKLYRKDIIDTIKIIPIAFDN